MYRENPSCVMTHVNHGVVSPSSQALELCRGLLVVSSALSLEMLWAQVTSPLNHARHLRLQAAHSWPSFKGMCAMTFFQSAK